MAVVRVVMIFRPVLIQSFLFQSSQANWPAHEIHQNFYDLYIANRSYEGHYHSLFEYSTNSYQRRELYDKVTQHFLVVRMYLDRIMVQDIKDKPQFTPASFVAQLGGALNLWAGITVVVAIEVIEFCYEVVAGWCSRTSLGDKSRCVHVCESKEGSTWDSEGHFNVNK